ncbi:hypothetical protein [Streptomyces sp. NBC_00122]|uniref:hypothetical protein n=1 Tax=Streptomyces sp. NBC_00122 TaxID=2903623 RepID=UPI003244B885
MREDDPEEPEVLVTEPLVEDDEGQRISSDDLSGRVRIRSGAEDDPREGIAADRLDTGPGGASGQRGQGGAQVRIRHHGGDLLAVEYRKSLLDCPAAARLECGLELLGKLPNGDAAGQCGLHRRRIGIRPRGQQAEVSGRERRLSQEPQRLTTRICDFHMSAGGALISCCRRGCRQGGEENSSVTAASVRTAA